MIYTICRLTEPFIRATTVSRSLIFNQWREMHCRKIVFKEYGDPLKVTELVEDTLPDKPDDEQVWLLEFNRTMTVFHSCV